MTQIDLCKRLACFDSWLGRLRKHVESGCEHLEGWYLRDGGSLDLAVRMKWVGSTQIRGLFSKSGWHAEFNLVLKETWGGWGVSDGSKAEYQERWHCQLWMATWSRVGSLARTGIQFWKMLNL